MTLKYNFNKTEKIDEKSQNPHAGEPKKKTVLHFKNGASVELTEKTDTPSLWEAVGSVVIEQWFTKDEFKKLYPEGK